MRTAIARGVLVALVGCGGTGLEINTTQDNVCDQIAKVACFDMSQCCSEAEIESALMVSGPGTEIDCQNALRTRCESQVADFDRSIKNKRVRFDSEVMNACLKEFVAPAGNCVTVGTAKPWAEACMTSAWVGLVNTGGACDFGYECATDNVCAANGTCTALPTENMPCPNQVCASGLWCDFGAAGGLTCHPILGPGSGCISNAQCQKGLFCDTGPFGSSGSCTPARANGATCYTNLGCASTLCLTGTCSNTGSSCFDDLLCRHCSNNVNNPTVCINALDCEPGTCLGYGTFCFSDAQCFLMSSGTTCVNPPSCDVGRCTGDVCAEPQLTIDYCTSVLADLPLLGGGQGIVGGGG